MQNLVNNSHGAVNQDVTAAFYLQNTLTPFLRWATLILCLVFGGLFLSRIGESIIPADTFFISGMIVSCLSMLLTLFILNQAYITAYQYYFVTPVCAKNSEALAHVASRKLGNLHMISFTGMAVCFLGGALTEMSSVGALWGNIVHYSTIAVDLLLISLCRDLHETVRKNPK